MAGELLRGPTSWECVGLINVEHGWDMAMGAGFY